MAELLAAEDQSTPGDEPGQHTRPDGRGFPGGPPEKIGVGDSGTPGLVGVGPLPGSAGAGAPKGPRPPPSRGGGPRSVLTRVEKTLEDVNEALKLIVAGVAEVQRSNDGIDPSSRAARGGSSSDGGGAGAGNGGGTVVGNGGKTVGFSDDVGRATPLLQLLAQTKKTSDAIQNGGVAPYYYSDALVPEGMSSQKTADAPGYSGTAVVMPPFFASTRAAEELSKRVSDLEQKLGRRIEDVLDVQLPITVDSQVRKQVGSSDRSMPCPRSRPNFFSEFPHCPSLRSSNPRNPPSSASSASTLRVLPQHIINDPPSFASSASTRAFPRPSPNCWLPIRKIPNSTRSAAWKNWSFLCPPTSPNGSAGRRGRWRISSEKNWRRNGVLRRRWGKSWSETLRSGDQIFSAGRFRLGEVVGGSQSPRTRTSPHIGCIHSSRLATVTSVAFICSRPVALHHNHPCPQHSPSL